MTEDSSEDSGDIYKDLDTFFSPEDDTGCDGSDDTQIGSTSDAWIDYSDVLMLPDPIAALTARMDSERKKMEMDLLLEFVVDEGTSRKAKLKEDPEYQELRNEVTRLQNLNSKKDAQILELTKENVNLKKNICSLYKTAKSEVEQKDLLLTDANKRLDYLEFRQNRFKHMREKYSQTDNLIINTPEASARKSIENATNKRKSNLKDKNASRKRSLSPNKGEIEQGDKDHTSAKQSRIEKCDSNVQVSSTDGKVQCVQQSQNDSSVDQSQSVGQSPESLAESNSSKAATETDDRFDLLPDMVRRSFIEYELSQIESLCRLKQSFVDHYFTHSKNQLHDTSGADALLEPSAVFSPATKTADAKAPDSPKKEMNDLDVSMENEKEIPILSPEKHINNRTSTNERKKNSSVEPNNKNSDCTKTKNRYNSKAMNLSEVYKYDIVKYYRQKREKMPILLKRQVYKYHRQTKKA